MVLCSLCISLLPNRGRYAATRNARAVLVRELVTRAAMWRRPALLGTCLQRLPVFCRSMASKYAGTQYRRNLINSRKPKPGPPIEFAPVDPEQKEQKMRKVGANLYDLLSRMPNYGIGYRVYRDSWKLKG